MTISYMQCTLRLLFIQGIAQNTNRLINIILKKHILLLFPWLRICDVFITYHEQYYRFSFAHKSMLMLSGASLLLKQDYADVIITFYSLQGEPHNEPFGFWLCLHILCDCINMSFCFDLFCIGKKWHFIYNCYLYCANKKQRYMCWFMWSQKQMFFVLYSSYPFLILKSKK